MSKNINSNKLISQKNKFFAAILTLLITTSILLVFSSTELPTAKAQTTSIPNNLLQYEWTQPAASPTRSCFSAGPAPNSPNIQWKVNIPGANRYLSAFDGKVFVAGIGECYAIDAATGAVIWKNKVSAQGFCKIDDTYMIAGSTCVKISDGTTVWTGPPGFAYAQSMVNGAGYIPELKMFVDTTYGWNLPDPSNPPTLAWNLTDTQNVAAGGCVYGDGKVFIGGGDYVLKAVDAKTGTLIWKTMMTSAFIYGASYYNGMVIQGGLDNNMHAWDGNTGKLLWTYNPGTWYGQWASSTGVAYGMVYEHNQDNYVYAINATTGQLVWRQPGPGIGYSNTLTIADGKVYVQMGETQYRDFNTGEYAHSEYDCFDAYTGQLIWTLPMENGAPFNSQCVAYGNLYVIPTFPGNQQPGVWTYVTSGTNSMNEVWCISSTDKDTSMFLMDPEHSAEGDGPTNLQLKWKFTTGGPVVSPATCVNGVAYFGSSDSKIYAVDANTGVQKWSFETDFLVYSAVAVTNGKVFTGADDGNVYCLDAVSGNQLWKTFAGGVTSSLVSGGIGYNQIRSSPMVLGGRIYVGALDGNLYCLDANSGAVVWKFRGVEPCAIYASPTISEGAIYLVSTRGGYPVGMGPAVAMGDFYKLDLNGNVMWHNEIPYQLDKTPGRGNWLFASATVAPDLGMVFMRNGYRLNYAFNISTGENIWTYDGRYNPGTVNQWGGVPQVDAMLYKYGALYFNDYYGITCRNAKNGSEVWYTYLSRELNNQGITYAYGRIYVTTEFGVLYVLDASTGAKLSYYEFGTVQLHSSPTPYNGYLYVGSNDWSMYCFGDSRIMSAAAATPQAATLSSLQVQPPSIIAPSAPTATPATIYIAAFATIIAVVSSTIVLLKRKRS